MTTTFIVSSLLLFAVLVFLIFWYFLSPDVRYNKNEAEQQKKAGQYDCSNTNVPVFNFKVLDIETDDYGTEYMKTYIAGVNHHCDESDIGGYIGFVKHEPNNKYDKEAMAIISTEGKLLGYIPKAEKEKFTSKGSLDTWSFVGYVEKGDDYPVHGRIKILFTNNQNQMEASITSYVEWLVRKKGVKYIPSSFKINGNPKTKQDILTAIQKGLSEYDEILNEE